MPIPPGGTTTPALWLIGDYANNSSGSQCTSGQSIATGLDQSGNGHHATAGTAPTWAASAINGHAAWSFDGATTYLNNAYTGELGTVIVVYKNTRVGFYEDLLGAAAASGNYGAYYLQAGANNTGGTPLFQRSDTSDSGSIQTFHQPVVNLWTIVAGKVLPGSTNTVAFYKHNLQTCTNSGTTALKAPSAAYIGCGWYGGNKTDFAQVEIAEIIVYQTAISDSERQSVVANLETKYGLAWQDMTYEAAFFQSGVTGPGGEALYMNATNDGKTFVYMPCDYAPASGHVVRDPDIVQLVAGGTVWMAHTNAYNSDSAASTSFDVASSTGNRTFGRIFKYVTSVDMSSITGTSPNARCWAPRWAIDPTAPQGLRIIVSCSSDNANFVPYETHPTNAAFTTWSTPVQVTGTDLPSMIDNFVIEEAGTYYWFFALQNGTNEYIELMTSTALLSGYTVIESGDWAGWSYPKESPYVFRPPGGGYQILLDADGGGLYYSKASSLTGPWSGPVLCTGPFTVNNLQHGSILQTPTAAAQVWPYLDNDLAGSFSGLGMGV